MEKGTEAPFKRRNYTGHPCAFSLSFSPSSPRGCCRENADYTEKVTINLEKKKACALSLDAHTAALCNVPSSIIITR